MRIWYLNITPTWRKASGGHDTSIPVELSSYSVVPIEFPMMMTLHRSNLTPAGLKSVQLRGLRKEWGGRFQIHQDAFWAHPDQWLYGLTFDGAGWKDPNTGEEITIDTPYNYELDKKRKPGEKTYVFGIDWKGLCADQRVDLYYNTTNHAMMFRVDIHPKYIICICVDQRVTVTNKDRWHKLLHDQRASLQVWEENGQGRRNFSHPTVNYVERVPQHWETAPGSGGTVQALCNTGNLVCNDDEIFKPITASRTRKAIARLPDTDLCTPQSQQFKMLDLGIGKDLALTTVQERKCWHRDNVNSEPGKWPCIVCTQFTPNDKHKCATIGCTGFNTEVQRFRRFEEDAANTVERLSSGVGMVTVPNGKQFLEFLGPSDMPGNTKST